MAWQSYIITWYIVFVEKIDHRVVAVLVANLAVVDADVVPAVIGAVVATVVAAVIDAVVAVNVRTIYLIQFTLAIYTVATDTYFSVSNITSCIMDTRRVFCHGI